MGLSKLEHFTDQFIEESRIFKALGHPARLAIVKLLIEKKECVGTELNQAIPLAQPTISQHLRELKEAGIIKGRIEGTGVCYCINLETIEKMKLNLLAQFDDFIENQNCNC
ncbi:MAG: ArsR/SmtB family transcription factor [Crocinitomicaceae bacterium]|jgi:DNA-binding transcriptional ArsR family regulator